MSGFRTGAAVEGEPALRVFQLAAGVLLTAWAGIGLAHSVAALVPATKSRVAGQPAPTVGMPTGMTPAVEAVRGLLPPDSSRAPRPWLVLLPPDNPPVLQIYLRYQLAYLEFPRIVRVVSAADAPTVDRYGGVIAHVAVRLPDSWQAVTHRGGFIRYQPAPE